MLEVFYKLLLQYEVAAEDFIDQTVDVQGGGKALLNKAPGHSIMTHLLNDTAMLKMVRCFPAQFGIDFHQPVTFHFNEASASIVCIIVSDFVHH